MSKSKMIMILAGVVCALAVTAAPASAFFKAEKTPLKITAAGTAHKFVVAAGSEVECATANFYSEQEITVAESSQLKMAAKYEGCETKALLKAAATVNMNQCQYNFHQGKGETVGTVSLECPKGQHIEINTGLSCTITVGEPGNLFLKKVTYTNLSGGLVEVKAEVSGITFASSGSGCSLGGIPANGTTGKYIGTAIAKGENGLGHVNISVV